MKTVIFSDTHLTSKFHSEQFDFIAGLIDQYDRVIINGDFWDGYLITFDQFLNSEWNGLFPLLKAKETIYIFGNHDREEWQDERYELFAKEAVREYLIDGILGDFKLHIEHGDRFVKHLGDNISSHRNLLKLFLPYYRTRILAEKNLGRRIKWKKDLINQNLVGKPDGAKIIQHSKTNLPDDTILVASHLHAPAFLPDEGYINTGMINSHLASYLRIEDGVMELRKEIY